MKKLLLTLLSLTLLTLATAQEANDEKLVGEWRIDLRPTTDEEPYYQIFAIEAVTDSGLTGSFYGSPLEDGYLNTVWPEVYFAFTTNDATNAYYHSGYLKDGKLYGTSYCPGRNFIARWTGERAP